MQNDSVFFFKNNMYICLFNRENIAHKATIIIKWK